MSKKKYLEESERKLIESVNNAYIPTDWDEFEKRYHEMERYGDGKPRKVDKEKMEYIEDGLVSRGIGGNQLSSLLSTIVEESGGNPLSVDGSGKFRGLIQFSKERYPEKDFDSDKKAGWKKAVDNQLDTIVDHLNEYGGDYGFLDGGKGSGYMTGEEAKDAFWGRDSDIENVTRALTYGFVRPGDRSGTTENRTRVARLINEIIQPPVEAPDILEFDYDGKHYKATKPEEVTPEMRRALMLSKLVGEKNKVELQDPLYTTFDEAYGRAKGKGARVFMWNGKKYSTKEEGGEVKDMEKFGEVLESLYNEDVERVRNGERAQYFGVLNNKPLKNVYPEFDLISKPANMVYKGADMIVNPISKVASSGASGFLEKELAGPVYWTKKLGDFMKALYLGATRPIFNSLPESAKPLARQVFKHLYQWRHFTLPDTVRLSRELFGGEDEPESFDAAFKAAREQGLDTFEWNGNEYSTEMKEEGGETNAAEFSLPEVNIYPNNRFGDIARSQGLKTARQWMEVRNATTNGINDFVNDPRTQFVLGMLPLPMGAEGVEEISNLIKRAKDFRQISKDLRITPWMEQQLIDDAVEKANWRILEDEGALGQGRLITQQDRPSVELTLKPKSQKNSGEYATGRKFINNKLWWSHRKPFYWGATRDGSKRILYSIDGNNVDLVRAKDLDPEYPNSWVYLTDEVVLTDPKLNTKFFVPTEGGYFIPSSHYRFTQWKDDMVDMMNTVKPEEWAEFRDGGWTEEDENDFQKWYAKIAEYKGLNPDPDDENQYYDYRTYWLENPEAARRMLEDDPEAHFTDRYKYPGHPTFSDESMYSDEEYPGGHWETVDGVGYYVPSEYTKSYIDRTIEYLAGQNEGVYIDGEYKLIPKRPDGGASRLAPRDNTSVGHPGKSEDINRNLGVHKGSIDFTELAASFVPVVGDVMDVQDFIRAREEGDNVGMLLASLGFLPIVGGIASAANKARRVARLTSHLQGEDAVKMFKEYGRTDIPENSELAKQLKLYLPDIRNRYGLVGNDDISDDDIIGSIYKHIVELSGDSKNLNDMGEPQILFRGDTKRYDELMDRITPEDLVEGTGTMDNSLGNLFLDRIPEEGSREGIDRYLNTVNADKWGSIELSPSATGSGIVSNKGNVYKDSQRVKKLPSDVVFLYKRGDGTDIYRMPVKFSNDGANDINGFIVRTGDVRDATREIAIDDNYALTSDAFDLHAKRPTTDEEGFIVDESTMRAFDNIEDEKAYVRRKMAEHYSNLLKDAEANNQGLLRSGYFVDERGRRFNPFRGEHTDYNYYALPNFNKQNAKHVLPYDLRVPTDWSDANIYRKEGGPSDLAPRDNTSVGRPGPADVQPVKPSAAARENPVVPFVASLLPGIGDVIDAHDFIQAAKDKNMVGMALAAAGFIPLVGDAFQEAARFARGRRNSYVRYDAPPRRSDIKESDEELLKKMPDYARPGYPAMEALNVHRRRLSDGAYEQRTGQDGAEAKRELEGFAETFPGIYDRIFDLDYINGDDMEAARRVIEIIDKQPKGSAGTMSDEGVVKRLNDIKQRLARSSPAFAEGIKGNAGIISLDNWSDFFMDEAYRSGISHELDHAVYLNTPEETIKELSGKVDGWFDSSRIEDKGVRDYVSKPMELLARGTQIKDFYGLTDNAEKVTPEMLKFAARHYADNVMDNQMTEFFNGIKDWDKAAEWISKYSTATLPAIAVSKLLQDGKEKDEYPVNRRHGGPISEDGSVGGDYILDDGGRSLYRRSEYIKNRLLSKYNLLPEESDGIISDLIGKSSLDEKFYDPKHKAYGIGQWSGKDLKEFVSTYKDGGLIDQIDFLAKKYWSDSRKSDIEPGVFDDHRWVVKRIGNEEFYTNSPLLKTLPSMSREDVALSLLPPELWPGILKRKEDVTGKSARRHFIRGGEVSELQDYIYDRLTKEHGIAPIQAIGIVANLTQESALNYDALGDNGRSYGIQQWQGDRRKNLFEFAKKRGRDKPALDDQVDFLVEEYKGDGFLFPTRGENMYKTGKTDKDMFDYFQYSKLDFDNAANIYDSTRAWAQGFGRGNKNFLNMDRRFHIAKTLSSRYNIDAGGQSFYTDMDYKDEWGSPIPEVAVSAEKKAAQEDWMEKYGNKMLASILAGDGEGGDTHVTNNYYVNEEGLSEDEKRNAAEVRELQQKQQAQELLASIIDGIKLDIKGVTEVRKR